MYNVSKNGLCCILASPIVHLRLGSSLVLDEIKEGDDVYFDCVVTGNPRAEVITWKFNVSSIHDT